VMQVRPAPVQVTYIGYPATTGLSSIDYRIVDSHTDPAGSERLSAERLVRLDPCFLCYEPWEGLPPVAPLPSLRGEPFTFGSFNNSMKINDRTLRLWARVLEAVPGSRLFLKLLETENEATRRFMLDRLAGMGIPEHRLIWKTREKDPSKHLSSYDQVDVGLNPYPYCGTTTTCEALQMGVPVLTLVGDRHASRVGKSLMEAVGLGQFCATSEDAYVEAAKRFAADLTGLDFIRNGLRGRWETSPLRDQAGYSERIRAALRGMWRARCGK